MLVVVYLCLYRHHFTMHNYHHTKKLSILTTHYYFLVSLLASTNAHYDIISNVLCRRRRAVTCTTRPINIETHASASARVVDKWNWWDAYLEAPKKWYWQFGSGAGLEPTWLQLEVVWPRYLVGHGYPTGTVTRLWCVASVDGLKCGDKSKAWHTQIRTHAPRSRRPKWKNVNGARPCLTHLDWILFLFFLISRSYDEHFKFN